MPVGGSHEFLWMEARGTCTGLWDHGMRAVKAEAAKKPGREGRASVRRTREDGERPRREPRNPDRRACRRHPRSILLPRPLIMHCLEPDESARMRDIDVRIALRRSELARFAHDGESRVVEEMGIFRGEHRIDAAVVNGHLHGYEIKSAKDTLTRLPTQAAAYGAVFDFLTLVAATGHLERAATLLPPCWGLALAEPDGPHVRITPVRPAIPNPLVDPYHVAQLLWKVEALDLLDRHGGARGFRGKATFTI